MKSNDSEATLRKGDLPRSEKVQDAHEDEGAHRRSVKQQTESNEPGIHVPDAK